MQNDLLLLSGADIPFPQAQLSIHSPTIKEIAYIGEESFFGGCELLNFSKDILSEEDKINLDTKSNFEVFMSIMKDKNIVSQKARINVMLLLTLIFPQYSFQIQQDNIALTKDNEVHLITKDNFEQFKEIIIEMFCLKSHKDSNQDYNPAGKRAREIAEKMKKGRQKAAAAKGESQKVSLLSRYISILSVGEKKDMNELLEYTVYQLFDEFNRFELKLKHDYYFEAKLAGAKDLEEVENWMKDIHS